MTGAGGEVAWRRLHPLSPVVRSGRGVLAVLAVVAVSAPPVMGTGRSRWYDLAIPAVAAAAAVINWLVTRWRLEGSTLRIETGLLRRDSRQLPIARIQAVDLVRPVLARALGLAEVRVRLAGSNDADGRLAYLPEQAALELRAYLLAAHHGLDPATPEPAEQIAAVVPTGRLVGSVVLSTAGLAAAAAVAGLILVVISPLGAAAVAGPGLWWLITVIPLVWRRVAAEYGFTVARSGDGIRIRRGLLGTVAETIPVARIQAVRMVEPLLWRPMRWCRLEVDVAGTPGHDKADGSARMRKALLPVSPRSDARWLLSLVVPDADCPLTRPPRRAAWKAPLSYHLLAAGHTGAVAVAAGGRIRRATTWVPLAKTQSVRFVQGPVQRCLGLATVHLDAAGRRVRAEFSERAEPEARQLVDQLAALSRSARRQQQPAPANGQVITGPGGIVTGGQAASVASPVNAAHSDE